MSLVFIVRSLGPRVSNRTSAQNTGIAGASAYLRVLTQTLVLSKETLTVQQIAPQALCSARLVRNTQRSRNSASKTPINANNVLEVNARDLLHILRSFNSQSDMHIYRHVCLLRKSYTCHVLTIFYQTGALNLKLNLSPSHLGSMAWNCLVFGTQVCLFIRKEYRPQIQLQLHSAPTKRTQ